MPLPRFDPIAEINVKRTVKREEKEECFQKFIEKNCKYIIYIYTYEQFAFNETRFILDWFHLQIENRYVPVQPLNILSFAALSTTLLSIFSIFLYSIITLQNDQASNCLDSSNISFVRKENLPFPSRRKRKRETEREQQRGRWSNCTLDSIQSYFWTMIHRDSIEHRGIRVSSRRTRMENGRKGGRGASNSENKRNVGSNVGGLGRDRKRRFNWVASSSVVIIINQEISARPRNSRRFAWLRRRARWIIGVAWDCRRGRGVFSGRLICCYIIWRSWVELSWVYRGRRRPKLGGKWNVHYYFRPTFAIFDVGFLW